jgi:Acetyltransferase (GNAT) domain
VSARTTVRVLGPGEYGDWQALLAASRQNLIYSSPAYLEALCAATSASFRLLGVFRGDDLAGGVALFERRTRAGVYVDPRLLLYYNGVVVREPSVKYPSERTSRELEVHRALCEALAADRYGFIALKNASTVTDVRAFLAQGWTAGATYTYVVPLDDLTAQWGLVEQNLRRLIKRCGDAGLTLSADDDFDSFHALHAGTLDRKGAAQYLPKAAFAAFYQRLREQGLAQLYHARLPDGTAASSQLVLLGPHPGSHTVAAATHPDHLRSGATAFLRWKVFEALAARGYQTNDLTDAALNPVTHFKAQFGGRLELCFVLTAPASRRFRRQAALARLRGALSRRLRRS